MSTLGDMLVLVDFQGQLEDELTIKPGDLIKNVKKTDEEGWLQGEINGKRGFFPQCFAKEIPSFFLTDNGQRLPRSVRKASVCIQKKKQRWCRAEYAYNPGKPDELELVAGEILEVLEEIEDGWWLGKKGDLVGAFPSNFVQELSEPPPDKVAHFKKNNKQRPKMMDITFTPSIDEAAKQEEKGAMKNQKDSSSSSFLHQTNELARVMFDYLPSMPDELALKKGDVVSVISKETEDEGWWRGDLNGKIGVFPDNFVISIPSNISSKDSKPPVRIATVKVPLAKKDTPTMDLKSSVNRPQSPSTVGQKDQSETKEEAAPKVTHQPKKTAPPPPVALKSKTNASPAKSTTDSQTKPTDEKNERNINLHKAQDSSTLEGLRVSSVKLAHPTTDRPKMQGKRLPKSKPVTPENESVSHKEDNQVNSHSKSTTSKNTQRLSTPASQAASPTTKISSHTSKRSPEPVQNIQVEDLMAEIKSLKIMMDMLKNKHLIDVQEIRSEISEERLKRIALQTEVENLKKLSS